MLKRIKLLVYNFFCALLNFIFEEKFTGDEFDNIFWKKLKETAKLNHKNNWVYFLWPYKKVKNLIWQIKFLGDKERAKILGQLVGQIILDSFLLDNIKNEFVLVPIPAHPKRVRERGFNQTEVIGKAIFKTLKNKISIKYWPKNFRRVHYDKKQSWKNRKERLNNLGQVYSIKNASLFKNKILIVLDDVITTGATMEKARSELEKIRPKKILGITIGG